MLNDISPSILNTTYVHDQKISEDDYLLCFRDHQVLLKKLGDEYEIPRKCDYPEGVKSSVYLFSMNSIHCFGTFDITEPSVLLEYYDTYVLRSLRTKEQSWLGTVSYQLMTWYKHNQFCGRCGAKTNLKHEERAIICPECHLLVYPKISPAVIVAITCNNKILLAQGKNYKGDFYALIAGYVDVGESIEATVVREVKEEIGLDIKNLKYYKSQPWPFSDSLMLGFTAEADDKQALIIDEKEIKSAAWFERGNLPPHASDISISGDLIMAFEKGII